MSSRLFQLLREKWGLVYTVSIDILQYDDCGVFVFMLELKLKTVNK